MQLVQKDGKLYRLQTHPVNLNINKMKIISDFVSLNQNKKAHFCVV